MNKKRFAGLMTSLVFLFTVLTGLSANAESSNRCLQFSGSNYAEAPTRIIPVSGDFTVEMWVYSSPSNNGKFVEFISQGAQPSAFYMGVDPNSYLRMGDTWMSTGVKIQTNTWTHVAYTHTSGNLGKLYVDGQLKGTTNPGINIFNASGTNTRFGSYYWPAAGEFFAGCIDDVRIWSSIRNEKEISDYKDISAIATNSSGLITSYSFDTLDGFYTATKTVYPDSVIYRPTDAASAAALTLKVPNQSLAVPLRSTVISSDLIENCFMGSKTSTIASLGNIPSVLKFNGRDSRQTSVDLLINGLPSGACVGMDVFVAGTAEPIISTVGIVSNIDSLGNTAKFRMNLDTSLSGCGASNTQIEVRGWWSNGSRFSQYGRAQRVPDCFGSIPAQGSSMLLNSSSVSLVGENGKQSPWALQTALKLKEAQLTPAAYRTNYLVKQLVQDLNGCHVQVPVAILQKIENGVWVDVGNADQWVKASNCDLAHPLRPAITANLPNTTVLRWKVSSVIDWEVFSAPFIHVIGANVSTESANPVAEPAIIKLDTPTNFSTSIVDNNLQIRVTLPSKTRSKVTSVILISNDLGYMEQNPLLGQIEGSFGIFRIPVSKLVGKSGFQKVYIGARGTGVTSSGQLSEQIDASKFAAKPSPSAKATPKASAQPTVKPTAKPTATRAPTTPKPSNSPVSAIKCSKGPIVRTFLASACPPGWKKT